MKLYTTKQMGDACEMLVAAEMTLAGIPAMKAPDYWPEYDVIAQLPGGEPQRVSVKSRTFKAGAAFVRYTMSHRFDWLAIVILPALELPRRRIFIAPRHVVDARASTNNHASGEVTRDIQVDKVATKLAEFEDNFGLSHKGCG